MEVLYGKHVRYNKICYFRYFILTRNIFPHLKIKYVPSADFYEIRNTVTDKFAICDGTLIVAMLALHEPYFPKHVYSYINLWNLVLLLEYASICVTDRTQYENVLWNCSKITFVIFLKPHPLCRAWIKTEFSKCNFDCLFLTRICYMDHWWHLVYVKVMISVGNPSILSDFFPLF